jgi:hypothetical protein
MNYGNNLISPVVSECETSFLIEGEDCLFSSRIFGSKGKKLVTSYEEMQFLQFNEYYI